MTESQVATVSAKIIEVIENEGRYYLYQRSAMPRCAGTFLGDYGSIEEAQCVLSGFLGELQKRLETTLVIKGGKS